MTQNADALWRMRAEHILLLASLYGIDEIGGVRDAWRNLTGGQATRAQRAALHSLPPDWARIRPDGIAIVERQLDRALRTIRDHHMHAQYAARSPEGITLHVAVYAREELAACLRLEGDETTLALCPCLDALMALDEESLLQQDARLALRYRRADDMIEVRTCANGNAGDRRTMHAAAGEGGDRAVRDGLVRGRCAATPPPMRECIDAHNANESISSALDAWLLRGVP